MTPSTKSNIDLAARLRLSVVRTARRMRQEAGTDGRPRRPPRWRRSSVTGR